MDRRLKFVDYLAEARRLDQRFHLKTYSLKGTAQQYGWMGMDKAYKRQRRFKAVRIMEFGRGWEAKRFYVIPEGKPVVVEVDPNGWQTDDLVEATLVSGGNQPAMRWAKRPYVSKKTGKPNPNVHVGHWTQDYMPNLEDQYGFLGNRVIVFKKDLQ